MPNPYQNTWVSERKSPITCSVKGIPGFETEGERGFKFPLEGKDTYLSPSGWEDQPVQVQEEGEEISFFILIAT